MQSLFTPPRAGRLVVRWIVWICLLAMLILFMRTTSAISAGELVLTQADAGRQVLLVGSQTLVLKLEAQPATGFVWELVALDEALVRPLGPAVFRAGPELGAPSIQTLRFQAIAPGETTMHLSYGRSWECSSDRLAHFTLVVRTQAPFAPLPTPSPSTEPVLLPSLNDTHAQTQLPPAFNWCAEGYCTPIKDQGRCGGCWAFVTTGVMEAVIRINDGLTRNLSEQHLISCNTRNWGCNGGWYAFSYYLENAPVALGSFGTGAVYANEFAYQAADLACNPPYQHHEQLVTWHYVSQAEQRSRPDNPARLKEAIATYGPVASTVCVGNAFTQYRGGIFTTDERASCGDRQINHGVVIVGWDDAAGVWIVRNSWGTQWGEAGYMRIAYGTSNIGSMSAYIIYEPNPQPKRYISYLPLVIKR